MTVTDELRRLLDERGVEWRGHGTTDRTWYEVGRISWFIHERENRNLTADALFLNPKQAVEATLGPATTTAYETECIDARCYGDPHGGEVYHIHVMECSACGHTYEHVNGDYEYCPHCRARIVEVGA